MTALTLQQRMAAAAAAAKAAGSDMNEVKKGAEKVLVPKGACRLRLLEYIELGIHDKVFEGKVAGQRPYGRLTFEVSGPNHKPTVLDDGRTIPHTVRIDEVMGQTAKNAWSKIFKQMAAEYPGVTQFYEMLGDQGGWRGTIHHGKGKVSQKEYATLKGPGGYNFLSKTYNDEESGEAKTVVIAPAVGKVRAFIWDYPSLEDWDSLYIEGTFDDGAPKNAIQEKIKRAHNWQGSPMYVLLMEAGREKDTCPDPKWKEFGGAASGDGDESEDDKPATGSADKAPPAATKQASALADNGDDPMAGIQ